MNYDQRIEIHNLAVVNGYNVAEADKFAKTHTYEEAKRKYGRDIHYRPINYSIHVREQDKLKKDGYNKKYFTEEEKRRAHVERQKRYLQRKKERMLAEKK